MTAAAGGGHRTREVLLTGRAEAPTPVRSLRAGEVSVDLDGIDLRRASWRGRELFALIYVAVRDPSWNNLPPSFDTVVVEDGPGPSFDVRFDVAHAAAGQRYAWSGHIVGSADGSIEYRMTGSTDTGLEYMRLGLNVLHGTRTYAGQPYRTLLRGEPSTGELPARIGIQAYRDGALHGMFEPFDRLEIGGNPGPSVCFDFEGEDFDMEDQRNFGDASFKTYSMPISRGGPYRLAVGEQLEQAVRISLPGDAMRAEPETVGGASASVVRLGGVTSGTLPRIGLGAAADGAGLSDTETARVAEVRPQHVRVEIDAGDDPAHRKRVLSAAAAEADALSAELHVDIRAAAEATDGVAALIGSMADLSRLPSVIFIDSTENEPPDRGESLRMLRDARVAAAAVSPSMVVGVGESFAFTNLNRWPFDGEVLGALSYALSPTVHLADDQSFVENLDSLEDMVPSIRERLGSRSLTVGPITLATRHGPYPNGVVGPDDLPSPVDVRQLSLLGAAWTVGCVAALAYSGADAATFFETVGWRGITERDAGSAMPAHFASLGGDVFPLWHVLADVAEWQDAPLVTRDVLPAPVFTHDVAALAVRDADGLHVLLSSLSRQPRSIALDVGGEATGSARVRMLDAATAELAMRDRVAFRSTGSSRTIVDGILGLELDAYATVRIDLA